MKRTEVLNKMRSWLGATKGSAKHLEIVATYNNWLPNRVSAYTRATKMLASYDWCACTVSAAIIACGGTDVFYPEISCGKLINGLKAKGNWVEDDATVPEPGWLIFYDWSDTGKGDDTTGHDHVGMVESVNDKTITTIEGNYNNKCQRRTLAVNGRYIRGYGKIPYEDESTATVDNAELLIWNTLLEITGNAYGAAGIMGNMYAESGLKTNNLQDTSNKSLDMTDERYTTIVNANPVEWFVKNGAGYGLCQWGGSRKKGLYALTVAKGYSVDNLVKQLEWVKAELSTTYKKTFNVLKTAKSVKEASNYFLIHYEVAADRYKAFCQNARAVYGQNYYDKYAEKNTVIYVTVVKGENLSSIAKAWGYISYKELLPLNPDITNPNKISVGQKIRVR